MLANFFNSWLPSSIAKKFIWWKAVLLVFFLKFCCTTFPNWARNFAKGKMYNELKGTISEEEFDKHFNPPYDPMQQRFCWSPQGDFFKPIR